MQDKTQDSEKPATTTEEQTPIVETEPRTKSGEQQKEKVFTQEEVNTHTGNARQNGKRVAEKTFLERFKVDSLDELEKLVGVKKEEQHDEMSQIDKLQAKLEEVTTQLESEMTARKESEQRRIYIERMSHLEKASKGVKDFDDVRTFVSGSLSEEFSAVFGDDNKVDDNKMTEFMKTIRNKKPHYFGTVGAGSPSSNIGASPPPSLEENTKAKERSFKALRNGI